ncbi:MAG TPA: hypothetical protein VF846_19265 [Thermoanaerobaculia bacterium]|jgi:hypothetical protein
MTAVLLDAEGHLRELRRVPPLRMEGASRPIDWSAAFRAAGLDMREFREAAPAYHSVAGSDRRYAWLRVRDSLRVEAASSAGLPVWFALPEASAAAVADPTPSRSLMLSDPLAVMLAVMLLVAMFFARLNVVRGRADARGALRVGLFATVAMLAGLVLIARHTTSAADEWAMLTILAGTSMYYGFVAWLCYLAIEPYVRRRWPDMLVGWTRLVNGRFRDPLVGNEILTGLIAGAAGTILNAIAVLLIARFAVVVPANPLALPGMRTPAGVAYVFLDAATTSLTYGLGLVTLLVAVRRVLRTDPAAWLVTTLLVIAAAGSGSIDSLAQSATILLAVMLALRFGGVLGAIAAFFIYYVAAWAPLTWQTSAWYFNRSALTMLALAALAAYAFRIALAHKPLFSGALVDDEANT